MKARVIAFLNIRTGTPELLPDNNPNDVFLSPNDIVEITAKAIGENYKDINVWYRLEDGAFIWSGGVDNIQQQLLPEIDVWSKNLNLHAIWENHNEKGEDAKCLILDSGIDLGIEDIKIAVEMPVINFVPGSEDINCTDPEGHGTHCASLIAVRNKTIDIGVATSAKILIGKINDKNNLDFATLEKALTEYLNDKYEFDVISISQQLALLPDEIDRLTELLTKHLAKNRVIVAAIGNDSSGNHSTFKRYPGALPQCISVGSCSDKNELSRITMNPAAVDIFCYGENIFSYQGLHKLGALTGTSQATAIVAGICTLIVSWLKKNGFTYSAAAIKQLLKKYAKGLSDNNTMKLIQPEAIFEKLENFKQHENKDLQHCIDNDINVNTP